MAKGGGSQDQSESSGILWIIAGFLVIGAILWYAFKVQLVRFYFKLKLWEIDLLSLFTQRLQDVRTFILSSDSSKLSFNDVVAVGDAVGTYLRIPVVLIVFILAFVIYFTNSTRLFKRTYNMRDLAELEKQNWPQISPVISLKLDKVNIDKGPWAMAMTPMQFCKRYHLLEEYKVQPREGMTRREMERLEVVLKRGQAHKIFSMQLGPLWDGIDKLPLHTRALFAIFAARFHSDTDGATRLLKQLSVSSVQQLDFTGADALLKKYESHKTIQRVIHSHAYVLTVMASMLVLAREDGVQASADFLWLKPIDRKLWYMLNTVGRQTPFVEIAGAFSHWGAEKQIGRRLLVPMVEEATNGLEVALKEIIYHRDEAE